MRGALRSQGGSTFDKKDPREKREREEDRAEDLTESGGSHAEERKESREDYGGGARREAPPQENITRGATGTAA